MTQPRPPLPWLLGYRLFGLRLPDEYGPWVAADTSSKTFLTFRIGRTLLWFYAFLAMYYVVQSTMHEPPVVRWGRDSAFFLVALVGTAACLLASGSTLIRRTLRWQRVDRHGRRVAPQGLARLGNTEAVIAGLLGVALVTAGAGVFSYGLRPSGPRAQPCAEPDAETLDAIRAKLRNAEAEMLTPREVPFSDMSLVAANVRQPAAEKGEIALWLVTNDKTIYELRGPDKEGASTFPRLGEDPNGPGVDRVGIDAVRRIGECLSKVVPK